MPSSSGPSAPSRTLVGLESSMTPNGLPGEPQRGPACPRQPLAGSALALPQEPDALRRVDPRGQPQPGPQPSGLTPCQCSNKCLRLTKGVSRLDRPLGGGAKPGPRRVQRVTGAP